MRSIYNPFDRWKNLEKRFTLANGFYNNKLNKDLYEVRQHTTFINECNTTMKILLEKFNFINLLPNIFNPTDEIKTFLRKRELQK